MPEQVRHDEKQMPDLSRILSAKQPLTLSGTPAGFLPWLLADLARAADKRAIFIAADEVDMRAVAATAAWFAPELDVFSYPAWDCLPYDRASPTLRVMAERLAALHRLQQPAGAPQLQLGGASCRARECQYVSHSGGGGTLKKTDQSRYVRRVCNNYNQDEPIHEQTKQ